MEDLKDFESYLLFDEELSENTIYVYIHSIKLFFESFDELNKQNILLWKDRLSKEFNPKTVNLRLTAIERYCKYKGIKIQVKQVKVQRRSNIENVITIEQYNKLLDGLKADGNEIWEFNIKVLGRTGARISEALQITKGDLVRGYAELYTKCKFRRIYIPKSLLDEAPQYVREMENSDRIMISYRGKSVSERGVVARALKAFAEKYGIPSENCYPHAFRHMFAIQFLKRSNNISLLADILGHARVNTTMIYTRMSEAQQKETLNKATNW